ncbi:hypothetical protein FHS29_005667 [Saccharothrix tamanrassetensis]|uniref:Uncharacterized protein n=1 Tax=Saccharothrix tamanrassetensis TaxID=1051531 RepID=A0A841CSM8_9PSEU|nr:hypothetical protein [Saccharothrix tamanrassetensis]MBB5959047.1 hypothetical protein [Saccharothrix tamanrassetensis]
MSAEPGGERGNLLQELFWTRTGLLLLILVVTSAAGLAISGTMGQGLPRNFVTAIATGTMISAVVGFGQTLITSSAAQRALITPVVEESRKALRDLTAEYRALDREFFPSHVFEPTARPDPAFNQLMMQDLERTRLYGFRGFAGRYAACRLLLSQSECELRAVLADPRDEDAISGRARYLLRHEGADGDYDTIVDRLREQISIGLVGLFLARSRCSRIDLTIVSDPPLDRLELFDDSAWLTLYSNTSAGVVRLYPRTLRFSEGSFVYGMERAEFLRISNSKAGLHAVITPRTTRGDFLVLFERITGSALSQEGFRTLEDKFHRFRREFSASAQLGS